MRELVAAWPPTATESTVSVRRPSDAAYTDAASPAGPAPTTTRSKQRVGQRVDGQPQLERQLAGRGPLEQAALA